MDEARIAELLGKSPLFSGLNERDRRAVVSTGKERSFEAGSTIIAEGDSGLGFYLILEGSVEVRHGDQAVRTLGPGDFFGEMALLDGSPRSADVVATEPTTCLVITSWQLHGLFGRHPQVAVEMLRELTARLRQTEHDLTE